MASSPITIQPYTHKQLAALYNVSWKTFRRWIRPIEERIGKKNGHFYTIKQVEIIVDYLGLPG